MKMGEKLRSKLQIAILICGFALCAGCASNEKLQIAAEVGNLDQLKSLLQNGNNVNSTDNRGRTPLYNAALCGHEDMVDYLLNHGADPNKGASWKGNQRPIHVAAMYGHVEIIQDLLRHGAKIDACTSAKETALHKAAWHGRAAAVEIPFEQWRGFECQRHLRVYCPVFSIYAAGC